MNWQYDNDNPGNDELQLDKTLKLHRVVTVSDPIEVEYAPVVGSPVVDAPVVDAPVVGAPMVDAPVAWAPGSVSESAGLVRQPRSDKKSKKTALVPIVVVSIIVIMIISYLIVAMTFGIWPWSPGENDTSIEAPPTSPVSPSPPDILTPPPTDTPTDTPTDPPPETLTPTPPDSSHPKEEQQYDDRDRLISMPLFNGGVFTGWIEYKYNERGEVSEEAEFTLGKDGAGRIIKRIYYDMNSEDYVYLVAEYNESGDFSMTTGYDSNSVRTVSSEFFYDSSGIGTEIITRFFDVSNGEVLRYTRVVLYENGSKKFVSYYRVEDKVGYLSETLEYNENGELTLASIYDESEVLQKTIEYGGEGLLVLLISEYNNNGVVIGTVEYDYNEDGEETERRERTYNSRGTLVETRFYRPGSNYPYRIDPPRPVDQPTPPPEETTTPPSAPPSPVCNNPSVHGVFRDPVTTYDSEGRAIRETHYYQCGCRDRYYTFTYDENGVRYRHGPFY